MDRRGKCDDVNSIHFAANSCVHVCGVAPPMVVHAWSMAGALRQPFEYYYYDVDCQGLEIYPCIKFGLPQSFLCQLHAHT